MLYSKVLRRVFRPEKLQEAEENYTMGALLCILLQMDRLYKYEDIKLSAADQDQNPIIRILFSIITEN
jgi:hypothetical protein